MKREISLAGKELKQEVEELSEALVFAERSDLQALADVHTRFEQIAKSAAEFSREVSEAAKAATALLEKVILDEIPDPEASMGVVERAVSAIQEIVRDGRAANEVNFPVELGLAQSGTPGAGDSSAQESKTAIYHPSSLPGNVDEAMFADFIERQSGVLEKMEGLVLGLEQTGDAEKVEELRRLIHTLKGEAGVLALDAVGRLCHATEDMLNNAPLSEAVENLLAVKDWLKAAFDAYSGEGPGPRPVEEVLAGLGAEKEAGEKEAAEESKQPCQAPPAPNPLEGDPELIGEFVSEAAEHLDGAEIHLLTLETEPENDEALNAVFRGFHTIKGVAGCLGLTEIGALAHEAENLLDQARKGALVLTGGAIDVTFDSVDTMKRLVERLRHCLATGEPPGRDELVPKLIQRLKKASSGQIAGRDEEAALPAAAPGQKLGEIMVESGAATTDEVEAALEKQREPQVRKKLGELLVDSVVASSGDIEGALEKQDAGSGKAQVGETLVESGAASREEVEAALRKQQQLPARPKLGEVLVREGKAESKDVAHALRSQKRASVRVRETVRVDAERLDRLVETIGELVIVESMVAQSLQGNGSGEAAAGGNQYAPAADDAKRSVSGGPLLSP